MSLPFLSSRTKWVPLGLLWLVCLLNYADRQAIGSLFPLLERDFGFSKAQLGLIGSAFMWVYALSAPLAGLAGDRFPRKMLVLGGCLFWSLMTGVTGLCGKFWQFLGARSLVGLGESLYFPAATSLISDLHGPKTRSTALSLHQSAVYIGTVAGGWLGALIAESMGWRAAFWVFGLAGVVVSLVVLGFLKEPIRGALEETAHPLSSAGIREVFAGLAGSPRILFLMAGFACANAVAAIFLVWAPTYLFERFHLGLAASGLGAVAWIQLASALAVPVSGVLADRFSATIPGARILVQCCGLLLGSGCVFLVGSSETLASLVAAMVGFGLCKGFYDGGIFASLFDAVAPDRRATAAGLMNFVGWGGGALGPLIVGIASSGAGAERMGAVIAWSGTAYLAACSFLLAAFVSGSRSAPPFKKSS
jgi:MFS family permease